ncbi:MAG: dihydrodipicolinate synthase family protein [Spirochaetota bacterium]
MNTWHGIFPPLVTPLASADTLDVAGFDRLVEHVIAGGVHGIFLLGTTGEGPSLSAKLKYETVSAGCRAVAKRVPVMVGITDTSSIESLALAAHAAACGADALVVAPPYYLPPGQEELLEYLAHLAPKLPLPLFLYNMPAMTKVHIDVATVVKASAIPNIIGMKDSSGNMIYYHELLTALRGRDFPLLIGAEELLGESILFGGSGGVPGGANIAPSLHVSMYAAAMAKDTARMLDLQKKMFALREIYRVGHYASSGIKGVKCALSIMGICSDFMAEPFHNFRSAEREKVHAILQTLNIA